MIDWTLVYTLTSPEGQLLFNQATGSPYTSNTNYLYLLDEAACSGTPGPLRITQDNVPQADGWIIHPSFVQGMQLKLGVQLWVENTTADARSPACDEDLCVMWDTLILHLKALQNPDVTELFGGQCRIIYTPACAAARMLDRIQLIEWPVPSKPGLVTTVEFTFATNFPYELDASEDTPNQILEGATETLVNNGTADMFPTYRVWGPYSAFSLINETTGLFIGYDGTFPGANSVPSSQFIEIDTFRNTVYLNGSGANYMAGINLSLSDFFPLVPGGNDVKFATDTNNGSVDVLWQSAWAN